MLDKHEEETKDKNEDDKNERVMMKMKIEANNCKLQLQMLRNELKMRCGSLSSSLLDHLHPHKRGESARGERCGRSED